MHNHFLISADHGILLQRSLLNSPFLQEDFNRIAFKGNINAERMKFLHDLNSTPSVVF